MIEGGRGRETQEDCEWCMIEGGEGPGDSGRL